MPISALLIMCLMRNHSVGKSSKLGKQTVSIDLFRGGYVFIRTRQTSPFLQFYKRWPGEDSEQTRALAAATAITVEISYWGGVMRTNRLRDRSISDIDTRGGKTNCDAFPLRVQRCIWDKLPYKCKCKSVCMCVCKRGLNCSLYKKAFQ